MNFKTLLATLALGLALSFSAFGADKVDINSADAPTLAAGLNGVGMKKAEAILKANIQVGNALKPQDITVWEYHWQGDSFTRSSHRMSDL